MVFKLTAVLLLVFSSTLISSRSVEQNVEEAQPHEFPYLISFQWNFNGDYYGAKTMHICAGTLLDEYHVLTTTRCQTRHSPNGFIEAVAAQHNVRKRGGPEQRRKVVSFFSYEQGRILGGSMTPFPSTFPMPPEDNDEDRIAPSPIVVIRVDKPFELNDKVKAVRLPEKLDQLDGNVTLIGWGSQAIYLQKVVLPLVDFETCQRKWTSLYEMDETNGCAGLQSTCVAEQGGPLMKLVGKDFVQVGIASWGMDPCEGTDYSTLYTNVANLLGWIQAILNQ